MAWRTVSSFKNWMIRRALKILSPSYYNWIVEVDDKNLVSAVPRPSTNFMKEYGKGGLKVVEIGVHEGENAESILKELEVSDLWLIDIWEPYVQKHTFTTSHIDYSYGLDIVKEKFGEDRRVKIWKKDSYESSFLFENDTLDFVYIDGNHDYDHVTLDIKSWIEKVKDGGLIAGHDVNNPDVLKAVKDFCEDTGKQYFLLFPDWLILK